MPHFLVQASYTSQAWAAMSKNPENREAAFKGLCERSGGRSHGFYFAFGANDIVAIFEAPDATTAAAMVVAANSAGHLKSCTTTPLLTNTEAMDVMKKAGSLTYQAPKG